MKQTAVEWLIEYCDRENWSIPNNIIQHAKAMEKVQIINVYWDAYNEGKFSTDKTAEEYYNQTFKQE